MNVPAPWQVVFKNKDGVDVVVGRYQFREEGQREVVRCWRKRLDARLERDVPEVQQGASDA
jgi:hypothetical protein